MRTASSLGSFAAVIVGVGIVGAENAALAQFTGNITRWTDQDALNPPATGSILFAGSSSIRRWEKLAEDFSDYKIIQRGFGGSQFEDLIAVADDIVLPYQASAIVVWEGTNDLASGETGNEVFGDYQAFVSTVHTAQPDVEIFYLGIMPTIARAANLPEETSANTQIAAMATTDPKLHYIDLPAAFNALPLPLASYFVSDGLHLNRAGYDVWTSVIRPEIEAVLAPNKVYSPSPLTPGDGARLLFDFGPSNPQDGDQTIGSDANGNHWNNWRPAEGNVGVTAGEHLGNLIDTDGNATGVDLIITGGFSTNGKVNGGLLASDPALLGDFAINTVTQDFFWGGATVGGGSDNPAGFMLDGLDPNLTYEFRFFGSRRTNQTRFTEFLVSGENSIAESLQTSGMNIGNDGVYDGNDDEVAVVEGIQPDQFGQVFVDITILQGTFAYLNAMEIVVTDPSAGLLGDADGDGDVDGDDLIAVQTSFGDTSPPEPTPLLGDADFDLDVDGDDLVAVRTNFGATASVAVPEPNAIALVVWGLAAWRGVTGHRRS